ncbi:lipopolysaccharide assembly protein LapB [Nocardiopsis sp. MG754419]|uniref:tetratricopeptide repeat protein n=1 Tax=Nocardiopsis sp. MG754419 TaxID=2259865 RepID=UPI001BA902A1|nr:tetratricopeptide repeat protein [Nocardiopsis sp. MG754419]MBR8744118.1 tetratricopeptide repeat protein [Nocardiopsis sp. MG754419]
MTTTSGSAARSGPADPPPRATAMCDQARDLAENGHLKRAAKLYQQAVAANPHPRVQARALLGLAVVQDRRGDLAAAREAARRALATGDTRYAPRAAYHLALSLEQEEAHGEAARVWWQLADLGGPAYVAVARYGLAREAELRGEPTEAEEHWEAALHLPPEDEPMGRLHATTVQDAARDLAGRLLRRGQVEAAAVAIERGLAVGDDPGLRLLRSAAHLERAIADVASVADPGPVDEESVRPEPHTTGAAVELLAGLLALRGEPDEAARAWRAALEGGDAATVEEVRWRLRRSFAEPRGENGEEVPAPWWEWYLEEAVATSSAPALAGELFAVITQMHALLAVPVVEGEARPAALRAVMEQTLRTPSELVWGQDVHADFRRRLAEAMGEDVLPEGWPEGT